MQIFGHTSGSIEQLAARLHDCPVRLRWGGPQVPSAINGQAHLLNGLEQLQKLQEAGIAVPEFTTSPEEVSEWEAAGATIFGRRLNHTQGKDIRCNIWPRQRGERRWRNSDFFVKYMESRAEWRFHVLHGTSIARGVKVFTSDVAPVHPCIRSRRLGWHLQHNVDPPKGARSLAKAAVAAVGYDLGAVDMLELADGTFRVLEVNSRPAIRDEYTLSAYTKALMAL